MFPRFSMLSASASVVFAIACSSSSTSPTTAQKLPIGSPCAQDSDCGTAPFFCRLGDHPGGYCMRDCNIANGDSDCPSEAICQFDGMTGECHRTCSTQTDCRMGYMCSPASNDPNNKASHAFCDAMMMGDGGMDSGADGMGAMDSMTMMDGMD